MTDKQKLQLSISSYGQDDPEVKSLYATVHNIKPIDVETDMQSNPAMATTVIPTVTHQSETFFATLQMLWFIQAAENFKASVNNKKYVPNTAGNLIVVTNTNSLQAKIAKVIMKPNNTVEFENGIPVKINIV